MRYGPYKRVIIALLGSTGVSLLLFVMRSVESQTDRYWFLLWNLFLAWLPLVFAWLLTRQLLVRRWLSWQNITLSVLWLGFLPNSFYLVSDLIHLHPTGEVSLLYDAVMFMSFIFNGFVAGFMSMFLVHKRFIQRIGYLRSYVVMAVVLFVCSFAIYLGRTLDWNTWDVVINPLGIIVDVSERVINPSSHPVSFLTTFIFFLLLMSVYAVIWELLRAARLSNVKR